MTIYGEVVHLESITDEFCSKAIRRDHFVAVVVLEDLADAPQGREILISLRNGAVQ